VTGGGGATDDTFTLNTLPYTEVANAVAPGGSDPLMVGVYNTTPSPGTSIDLFRGNIDNAGSWDETVNLFFSGNTTGLYTTADTACMYIGTGGSFTLGIDSTLYCNIEVTRYDAVGGRIQGIFDASLCYLPETFSPTCSTKYQIWGSFDVTREADQ